MAPFASNYLSQRLWLASLSTQRTHVGKGGPTAYKTRQSSHGAVTQAVFNAVYESGADPGPPRHRLHLFQLIMPLHVEGGQSST